MRKFVCYLLLIFMIIGVTAAVNAQEPPHWSQQFETEFSQTCEVDGLTFKYPKELELSETSKGVFLESDVLYGQISTGSAVYRDKAKVQELLVEKQGGESMDEYAVNGHTVYASTSLQGEQVCRTYVVAPKDEAFAGTLYIQLRWKAAGVDYTSLVDQIVASMQ